jgi:hypothetical protein
LKSMQRIVYRRGEETFAAVVVADERHRHDRSTSSF